MGLFDLFRDKSIRVKAEQFDDIEKQYLYSLGLAKAVLEIEMSVKEGSGNDIKTIQPEMDRINNFLKSSLSKSEIEKLTNEISGVIKKDKWEELMRDFLSSLKHEQKDKFIRSLLFFANSDGVLELDEMNIIGEWTRGCFPNKSDEELHNYLLEMVKDLSENEKKLNFDINEFNELQRKSILGLLIGVAGIDGFDDENKETDLLSEISEYLKITQSDMDSIPDFEEAIQNLKGLSIKQKSIFKYLVDLMVKADGELSKSEIEIVNYFNQNIILENDSKTENYMNKIKDMETYEKWLNTEITNDEIIGNIYDYIKMFKSIEAFEKEIKNMEIIFDELKEGKLLNEEQVKQKMIEIYSKEISESPMSIETAVEIKTSSDAYLQIENILGTLLNTMEEHGDTNSTEYSDTQQYHTITTFFYKLLNEKSIGAMFSAISGERDVKEENDNFDDSVPSVCLDCFTLNEGNSKYCSDCGKKL